MDDLLSNGLHQDFRRSPGTRTFLLLSFSIINHDKKKLKIYSFINLDSVSLAQIVFKYNKQHTG